jgi:hypothetical protein
LTAIRRVARVKTIAEAMAIHPGRSIPKLCRSPYAVKATYHLFKHVEATPETMQAGHRAGVLDAMRQPGVYVLLEDTTELSWSGKHTMAGLGPIGNSAAGLQGFLVHTILSVRWLDTSQENNSKRQPVAVIGLGDQQYYVAQWCCDAPHMQEPLLREAF